MASNGMVNSGLFTMARPAKVVDESLFTTAPCITRWPDPILTHNDVPYRSALTFNAGVLKKDGRYIMIFRNDVGDFDAKKLDGRTNLGLAFSDDGIHFKVEPEPCYELRTEEIRRITIRVCRLSTGNTVCALRSIPRTASAAALPPRRT